MFASIAALSLTLAAAAPTAVVKNADAEVQKILAAPDASTNKLAARADEFIDFGELTKRAMGAEWAKLNKKQQDELSSTMKGLLRASYAQKAVSQSRGDATKVEYGEEKITGNDATVATTLVVKQDRFPVTYKLYRADAKGAWKVFDVDTDGVSLEQTYGDSFRSVMAKKGFDGLLKSLKDKRDSLEKDNAAAAQPKN